MSWTPPPPGPNPPPEPTPPAGQGWPPPPTPQAPPASTGGWQHHPAPAPPVSDGLVSALKVLLVLQAAASLLISILRGVYAVRVRDGASAAELESTEIVLGLLVIGWFVAIAVPAVVCWCLWQSGSQRRLQALRPGAPFRHGPGWGVGAWFVPIANLFVPFRAVADLWRNSASPGATGPDPTPRTVVWWWLGVVGVPLGLFAVSFVVGFSLAVGGTPADDDAIALLDAVVGVAQAAALGVGAWFAIRLVSGIHARLGALAAGSRPH